MFQYVSGAGFKGVATQTLFRGEEARVPGWRGPTRRTGPAFHGIYPATDGPKGSSFPDDDIWGATAAVKSAVFM